jgi:hypothetical protein
VLSKSDSSVVLSRKCSFVLKHNYEDYIRKRLLFCISASNRRDSRRFKYALGEVVVRMTRYLGKKPPRIRQHYWEYGPGYIGEENTEEILKLYRIVSNETCLEIIRDYNWTPDLIWGKWRDKAEEQSSIGYIYIVKLDDRTSLDEAIEVMKLVPAYPHVVAVQKSDVRHDWHRDYEILTAPDTLTYNLDDIESVAEVYRALIHKMPLSDEDKQGFFDCIAWQVEHQDRT